MNNNFLVSDNVYLIRVSSYLCQSHRTTLAFTPCLFRK